MGHIQVGEANMAILDGTEDISLWSEEELRRGQRRNIHGKFQGRPPKIVPKALHDELVKRLQTKARARLDEDLYDAVAILGTIVRDCEASNADRLVAAKLIIERVWGRAPARVQLTAEEPWMVALTAGIVQVNGDGSQPHVIQAHVIESGGWEEEDG